MKRVSKWIGALLIALCLAVVLFPPFFILFSSLLSEWELDFLIHEVGSYAAGSFLPIRIPPYEVDLHQFRAVLLDRPEILRTLLNTMGYAAITLAGMFLVAPLAAFVFAKLRFKGNSVLFFFYVFLLLLPFQVLCVPLYLTVSTLHLMDTPWAFILPEIFSPLYVFLLRQFMRSIPDSILEAAALAAAALFEKRIPVSALPVHTRDDERGPGRIPVHVRAGRGARVAALPHLQRRSYGWPYANGTVRG